MAVTKNDYSRCYQYYLPPPYFSNYTPFKETWKTVQNMHYHPCIEFGVCKSGNGLFFVEDRIYPFSTGTFVCFPPDILHIAQSPNDNPSAWEYLFVDTAFLEELGWRIRDILPREIVSMDPHCKQLFTMMVGELSGEGQEGDSLILYKALCTAIIIHLRRLSDTVPLEDPHTRAMILPAIQYISEHYGETITMSTLAHRCTVSESTLRRAFVKVTSMPPMTYVNTVRITMAENMLLHTDQTVLEIATECGYQDISTFNRNFRQKNGISPSGYRILKGR